MRKIIILLACLTMSGCQTSEQRAEKIGPEMVAYIECGMNTSRRLASSPSDPYSIAIAAQSICAAERLALHQAIESTYHVDVWRPLKASFDQSFLEDAVASVVKYRAA
jgi:hypothetical protein